MKITINKLSDNNIKSSYRKENHFTGSQTIVSFDADKINDFAKGFSEPLSVRFYSTQSTTYCCVWGSLKGTHFNGSGKASGYGYHRESAALSEALTSAGFEVDGLSGTGQTNEAITKIAELQGLSTYTIVSAHP